MQRTTDFFDMTLTGFPRIAIDPAVCAGRPTVVGTRMRVSDVLEMLAAGATEQEILEDFPYITGPDICACLDFVTGIGPSIVA